MSKINSYFNSSVKPFGKPIGQSFGQPFGQPFGKSFATRWRLTALVFAVAMGVVGVSQATPSARALSAPSARALSAPSAQRPEATDWRAVRDFRRSQWRDRWDQTQNPAAVSGRTALDSAQATEAVSVMAELEKLQATIFTDEQVVEIFKNVRDLRFLEDSQRPDAKRRSTWLFPDDGCFARAALMIHNAFAGSVVVVQKIFSFGNLQVKTPNTPSGTVTWWYHVAPVLRTEKAAFVLDPAMDPIAPLTAEEWLLRQGDDQLPLRLAICHATTYEPFSNCEQGSSVSNEMAENDQSYLLTSEWSRLVDLGRNPEMELGDFPPWLAPLP